MNVLFINSNLYGHINPTLELVKKITEKGNVVDYYCSEDFSEQIRQMGAVWIGFSEKLELFLKGYHPSDRHPFYMLMEYILSYDEVVIPEILDLIKRKKYDFIICDSIFGASSFLKQMISIPVVCSHSSFAMSHAPVPDRMLEPGFHPQLDHCYQIRSRICQMYPIQEPSMQEIFISKGDINIVYTTKAFNGDACLDDNVYLFSGPSIDRSQKEFDVDFSKIPHKKLIYISLGSFNTGFLEFYQTCLKAYRNTEYYVFMSIGTKCKVSDLGDIPANFYIRSFLPQLEILKHADIFITHAGFNSVNEALYYGVPMIAFPMVNDQHKVAKQLVSMGLGKTYDLRELTPDLLRNQTHEILADTNIKENCIQMSKDMKTASCLEQTVVKLEEFSKMWKERNLNGTKE